MVSQIIFTTFTALFICLKFTSGEFEGGYSTNSLITVDGEFEGGFSTNSLITVDALSQNGPSSIQAAINAVPSNNKEWVTIQVKEGVYNERVKIPADKPFIYLKGAGIGKSNIVWGETTLNNPTFESLADNILVTGITFTNSYNYPPDKTKNKMAQAVAAKIAGDKVAFYGCSFLGVQDTLWDVSGRHYFVDCTIEGAMDFIFGSAKSIYQNCVLSVNIGAIYPNYVGFITAHGGQSAKGGGGFVFKWCTVNGIGKTMLGRAWMRYSFVIFYNSYLSNVVVPTGWSAWNFQGQEDSITYAEEQCRGPGSNKSNRVKWEKTLTPGLLNSFISTSYIDNEGWITKLPQH